MNESLFSYRFDFRQYRAKGGDMGFREWLENTQRLERLTADMEKHLHDAADDWWATMDLAVAHLEGRRLC
jgi:hypothetical protein